MSAKNTTTTRLATLAWNDEGVLVIRFRPEVPADISGVSELVTARVEMTRDMKARVMVVLAADMDFEIQVPTTDHSGGSVPFTLAEATVAPTPILEKIARMYYQYFPQPCPTAVFATEPEALIWLLQHPVA